MEFSKEDQKNRDAFFMRRCLQLAENGKYTASPNPMVGSVIVYKGTVIGEGFHIRPGEGHAEVNAIRSVVNPRLLKESTLYVNLEPCSHHGRTPSCANLIIQKGIKRVVIGCRDPFKKVNGNGIQKLKEAGIDTTVGILEKECMDLNCQFMTFHLKKRPYVVLKWAESADGFIDKKRESGTPQIFSTPHTTLCTHKFRAENNSILVGRRTALLDNPSLTVRNWIGSHPVRIVIDRRHSLPEQLNLFDKKIETLVFTDQELPPQKNITYIKVNFTNNNVPQEIMSHLHARNIQSVLIEGGAFTLQSFINSSVWDEAYIEKSSTSLEDGVIAPSIRGIGKHFTRFGTSFIHYKSETKL